MNEYIHLAESVFNSVGPGHNGENTLQQKLAPNVGSTVARHFQYLTINTTTHIQQLTQCPTVNIPASILHLTAQPRVEP